MPYKDKAKKAEWARNKRHSLTKEERELSLARRRRNYQSYRDNMVLMKGRIRETQRKVMLKLDILSHYGKMGKCMCVRCGESRLACLSIDHINGGGWKHRQGIADEGCYRGGRGLYLWLQRNNYPEGYQTLCMNCQWVKRVENNETRLRPDTYE